MTRIKLLVFFWAICFGIFLSSQVALGACSFKTVCNEKNYNNKPVAILDCCTKSNEEGSCQKIASNYVCVVKTSKSCSSHTDPDLCDNDDANNCIWDSGEKACVVDSEDASSCSSHTDEDLCDNDDANNCIWDKGEEVCVTDSEDASGESSTREPIEFSNPLEYKTVEELATNILSTLRSIIVVLSIIFIVLGGIFYITSAGNDERMKIAKGSIFASMIGLAIGIAAPSFLKEISSILGWNATSSELSSSLSLTQISLNFLNFLLAIVGVLAIIMLVAGGIMYLTSAGDEDRIKTAKNIVLYSIIGISVSLAALVIVKQIAGLLT
jgi:hypothetical protein